MKKFKLFLFAFIAATSLVFGTVGSAADCEKVVVIEADIARQAENTPPTRNWVLYTRNAGNGAFRTGPATPPSGVGSFETVTPTGADKATLFNFDHVGTALADIDKLSYATYQSTPNPAEPRQLPAINIQIDINGGTLNPGEFATLVYEPVYNTEQSVQANTWQTWDAYSGGMARWWGTGPVGAAGCDATVPLCTFNDIRALFPNATIVGGFGVNQGSGNPALVASTDVLTIGSDGECVTYDFEPFRTATTKDQCKNGGYNNVRRADGSTFKNQGDCVSYVSNGK